MTSIIGVHGIGNYRPGHAPTDVARHLADVWRTALHNGELDTSLDHTPITVGYYAHRLRPPGTQAGEADLDNLPADAQTMIQQWLNTWGITTGVPQGRLTVSLRQQVSALADHLGLSRRAVGVFTAAFFDEVSRYLQPDAPQRLLARTEVANAIAATPPGRIVIAHSLGSVITYETLHAYPHIEIDLLITIGSPLAIPHAVFHRLDPPPIDDYGQRPAGIRRWINIADRGDLVAIPPHGIAARFRGLDEDIETSIHWADFHLATNYLKTPEIASTLRTFLGAAR